MLFLKNKKFNNKKLKLKFKPNNRPFLTGFSKENICK